MVEHPQTSSTAPSKTAADIRDLLTRSGVMAFTLGGSPGSGKTSLILRTAERIAPRRMGIIVSDAPTQLDADRLRRYAHNVVQLKIPERRAVTADQIRRAIRKVNLRNCDVLCVENAGSIADVVQPDLGEHFRVEVFSVTAGDDNPEKHRQSVERSDLIVLNKIDLVGVVPFDLHAFRDRVRRLNPKSQLFELSTLSGRGMEPWISWLKQSVGNMKAYLGTPESDLQKMREEPSNGRQMPSTGIWPPHGDVTEWGHGD